MAEFEEREAAVYCHYTPREFYRLPVTERARCVAQRRLHRLIEAHTESAMSEAAERLAQRQGKG